MDEKAELSLSPRGVTYYFCDNDCENNEPSAECDTGKLSFGLFHIVHVKSSLKLSG